MPKLEMKMLPTRKKIIPLVMAIGNQVIKKLRFVEIINEAVEWDRNHWNISPGGLVKMLIMSTFTDIRTPLTHLEDRLEGIDIEHFLHPSDKSTYVNEYNVGEAMDRIAETDYEGLYETIALNAVQEYHLPMQRMQSDTTTLSFYGDYDTDKMQLTEAERQEILRIERGYNKDGRPGCNQVIIGQITNEQGIPLVSRAKPGATSDIDWNREAIKYAEQLRTKGFTSGIYVADSKLMIEEHVTRMNAPESRIDFVSRCPANFCEKLERRMIQAAYGKGGFVPYGPFSEAKDATGYKGVGFTEEIYGGLMRLIVLESSSLRKSAEQSYEKKETALQPIIQEIAKKVFACQADAETEWQRFMSSKQAKLFDFTVSIERRIQEKWPRGRRGPQTKPTIRETYHIRVEDVRKNEAEYQAFIQNKSCIVLASNAIHHSDEEIIKAYKGQHVVENSFRSLKGPQLASVIYLKSPERIQVLCMLLTFSLLVRALIQHRMRESLEEFREQHPDEEIRAGWGGRNLINPTFKLLYEHCVACCFERENFGIYSFAWPSIETKQKVEPLLRLLGFTLEQLIQ